MSSRIKEVIHEDESMTLEELCEKYDLEITLNRILYRDRSVPYYSAEIASGILGFYTSKAREPLSRIESMLGIRPPEKEERVTYPLRTDGVVYLDRNDALRRLAENLSWRDVIIEKDGTVVKLPKIIHIP